MQYNLPAKIQNESDLKIYESYLREENEISFNPTLENFLQKNIGSFARVEILNSNKTGVITNIGKDFLVLRRSNNNTLIPFNNIKSIILPRENQKFRHPENFLP